MVGEGFGEFADRIQRPVWIAVAGVFGLIVGAAMVTYAVVRLLTAATG